MSDLGDKAITSVRLYDSAGNFVGTSANPLVAQLAANPTINIGKLELLGDDGAVIAGSKSDTVWDGSAGSPTWTALWKYVATKIEAVRALLAGVLTVVVNSQTGTIQKTTVASGGTAADLFSSTVPANGFEVINPHATEILYISEATDAIVSDNSTSIPIAPKGYYSTPPGYKPTGRVSYNATTTGHAVIARRW